MLEDLPRDALRAVFDALPAAVFWTDCDGVYAGCNASFVRIWGDLTGRAHEDIAFHDAHRAVIASGTAALHVVHAVGGQWFETSRVPLRDESGQVVGVLGFTDHITERYRAQQRLQASEARLRSMFENHPGGMVIVDRDGVVLQANESSPGAVTGSSVYDFVDDEAAAQLRSFVARVFRGQEGLEFEMRGGDPLGRPRWYRATIGPVFDRGEVDAALVVAYDITEERGLAERVRQLESLLAALADRAGAIAFEIDAEGRFVHGAGAGLAALGLKTGDLQGMSAIDLYADIPGMVANLRAALAGREVEFDAELGGRTWSCKLVPALDDGRVVGVRGVAV